MSTGQRPRLFRTTAFRLGALYSLLFGAAVIGLFAFMYWRTSALVDDETNAAIAAEIAGLESVYRQQGLAGLARVVGERAAADPDGSNLYLLAGPGRQAVAGNLSSWPEIAQRTPAGIVFDVDPADGDARGGRVRARTFLLEGGYRLLVGRDLRQRARLQRVFSETLGLGLAATLGLGLVAAVFVGRQLIRRVEAINRAGRHIIETDFKERVPVTGADDEFDRLAENQNAMLDRIQRLMQGMREVTDNIAHDLKGPLTRAKARLELALLGAPDPAVQRAAIEQAMAETDRLLGTFNALLLIAEAESGAVQQAMQPVDLSALVRDAEDLYAPAMEDSGMTLLAEPGEAIVVKGHRQLLFQALANLLENTIKYAQKGGMVTVAARRTGQGAELAVADRGPGIPEAERARVLERYVRLDAARTTPGSGLGLSLVAAVAKLHGATLSLADTAPGLAVTLAFPASPAA